MQKANKIETKIFKSNSWISNMVKKAIIILLRKQMLIRYLFCARSLRAQIEQ